MEKKTKKRGFRKKLKSVDQRRSVKITILVAIKIIKKIVQQEVPKKDSRRKIFRKKWNGTKKKCQNNNIKKCEKNG